MRQYFACSLSPPICLLCMQQVLTHGISLFFSHFLLFFFVLPLQSVATRYKIFMGSLLMAKTTERECCSFFCSKYSKDCSQKMQLRGPLPQASDASSPLRFEEQIISYSKDLQSKMMEKMQRWTQPLKLLRIEPQFVLEYLIGTFSLYCLHMLKSHLFEQMFFSSVFGNSYFCICWDFMLTPIGPQGNQERSISKIQYHQSWNARCRHNNMSM